MLSLDMVGFYIAVGGVIGFLIRAKLFPWLDQVIDDHKKKESKRAAGQDILKELETYLFNLYEQQGWVDREDLLAIYDKAQWWEIAEPANVDISWVGNREGFTITVTTNIPGECYELKGTWEPPVETIIDRGYYRPKFQLVE